MAISDQQHALQSLPDTFGAEDYSKILLALWLLYSYSRRKVVKTDLWVHLTEAATMEFVSENTAIPVPKGYCSFVRKNRAYIVMERIQGEEVPSAWRKLNESSRKGIYDQLQRMIKELRSLEPPKAQGGLFATVRTLDLGDEQEWEQIKEMAAKQDGPWPPPVFTHGDLDPFNVLIRDGKVVGIIDWEFSGWYPHYWEYTTAWLGNATRTGWRDQLCESLDQFPAELVMDKVRHRWWGDF